MKITVNEKTVTLQAGITAEAARARFRPGADLVILNGVPLRSARDQMLSEGDRLVLITRGATPPAREFETMLAARHGAGVYAKLKKCAVGIAGAGGIGSHAAMSLARMGVGKLVLADYDVVEPSNLNRQSYCVSQLGMPKVSALAHNIEQANPYVKVKTVRRRLDSGNTARIFAGVDVFIEALDLPEEKTRAVVAFAKVYPSVPVIMVSGIAGCGPAGEMKTTRAGKNLYIVGDLESGVCPGAGLMAARVLIAAGMQANLAARLLLGLEKPLA
ncbi:MAG: sulfur carrier protein ThiS adenylyltransferase ThiF [Elusimicrobiaceae bacterium]|nr:sulfur carrier protein ThiS adenylyltransferase ThiF [Elusimicrobiaceae bacterium]